VRKRYSLHNDILLLAIDVLHEELAELLPDDPDDINAYRAASRIATEVIEMLGRRTHP
jgi:hypothetical protein